MKKVCEMCGYEPTKEQELDPMSPTEDCPTCGGKGTVVDQEADEVLSEPEEE